MKKMFLFIAAAIFCSTIAMAKGDTDSASLALASQVKLVDSIEKAMKYETGNIALPNGIIKLNVPAGFKYLNAEQSNYILTDVWGNPPQTGILGMLFPANSGPFGENSYAFILTYDPAGFVKDDDADKINYDDLLKDIQKEEVEENKTRTAQGYAAINIVGWASQPFYDKKNKVLHWAKNLHFAGQDVNTLNYEVRILGRKGILSMNAVATVNEIDSVKKDIDKVLAIPSFTEGNTYKDFDSKTDNVAAWTIGGLVAGKILLKVGFWGIIVKFLAGAWKFILIGLVAIWGAIKKFLGKKPIVEEDHSVPQ
ncbi:DUF2167 domain-containing protein [Ferruginibacter sp. SUN106]|uniref:DUF2167 domain-containing protein n=1 Tax=Ferruginibacter sp. SUN106 TaxID=2978348 RepID=UPI003D368297